jgi:hypothetical protein
MSRDNTRWGLGAAIALGVVLSCSPTGAQEKPPRSIKVVLKVESQGPEGMWMQVGKDLSSTELAQLRSLITVELGKLPITGWFLSTTRTTC